MVKSVLFDLDGTLLDRDTSLEQFAASQYDRLTIHLSHIPKTEYMTRFIELDCRGHVWKDKVYKSLVAEFQDEQGKLIRKAGVMGIVLVGGEIRPGNPIRIELPPEPYQPLDRV